MTEPFAVHRSKVDAALFAVLSAYALGMLVLGAAVLREGTALDAAFGAVFVGAGVFVLWVLFSVRYIIVDARLILCAGPLRRVIPTDRIVEVFPSRDPAPAWAISLDRLRVNYHAGGRWTYSLISPRDPAAFLRDLAAAAPRLKVGGGRAVRINGLEDGVDTTGQAR